MKSTHNLSILDERYHLIFSSPSNCFIVLISDHYSKNLDQVFNKVNDVIWKIGKKPLLIVMITNFTNDLISIDKSKLPTSNMVKHIVKHFEVASEVFLTKFFQTFPNFSKLFVLSDYSNNYRFLNAT